MAMIQRAEPVNSRSERIADPLDRDDPRVVAAREAEAAAYEFYGLDGIDHDVHVPALECRVRVVEVGSGPPVVLIPGGVGYGVIWTPLLPDLSDYRLLIMDRPGGGLSDGIDHRTMPIEEIAASSTAAVFDHFGVDGAPILANSMGGLWAFRFALEHPERTSAIVQLGCPALYPGTSAPRPMLLLTLPGLGRFLVKPLMQSDDAEGARETWAFLGHPPETTRNLPEAFAEAWYRMDNMPHFVPSWASLLRSVGRLMGPDPNVSFTFEDLRNVRPPVLHLWGSEDPFGSPEMGRRGVEHFPTAEFHEIGTGHLPWLDETASCGELVRSFIERHG